MIAKNSSNFSIILLESIKLLIKNPVLFLPKLLVALLYGIGILLSVEIIKRLAFLSVMPQNQITSVDLGFWFSIALILLIITIITYFLDLFFSALYPILINQAKSESVDFVQAIKEVSKKVFSVFIAGGVVWVLMLIISLVEAFIVLFFDLSGLEFIFILIIALIFGFVFYFLFPIVVFEEFDLTKTFTKTFRSSLVNKRTVFVYSLVPFSVSVIKYFLAFFAQDSVMLFLFWLLVIFTAVVYTIHSTMNQLLYLKLINK